MMNEQKGHKEIQVLRNSDLIRDSRQLFIFKKTEKIVSAIFLITESFSNSVPQLAEEMRGHAMGLLKRTLSVKSLVHFEVHDVELLIRDYLFLRSLFAVAHQSRLISDTNFSIVEFEMAGVLARLRSIIETPLSDSKSDVFSKEFFNVEDIPQEETIVEDKKVKEDVSNKGHVSYKGQVKDMMSFINQQVEIEKKQKISTPKKTEDNGGDKVGRLETITALLRKNGQSSIKDIYDSFDGVSEKTIQRDLQTLVQRGLVIKEGEKRWSTYKIAR